MKFKNFRADIFSCTCKKLRKFGTNFRAISRKLSFCAKMHENLSARKFIRIRYMKIRQTRAVGGGDLLQQSLCFSKYNLFKCYLGKLNFFSSANNPFSGEFQKMLSSPFLGQYLNKANLPGNLISFLAFLLSSDSRLSHSTNAK